MKELRFVKSNEKRDILKQLNEQFGIEELNYLLIESGREKLRAFSGTLSKDEISKINQITNIELIGTYFIKKEGELRLSFDAPLILRNQIKNNMIEINDSQFEAWIRGNDIQIDSAVGIYIVKYKDDFIGCGKSNGKTLFNFVPKDRRLKK